jgi:hypothetical protein
MHRSIVLPYFDPHQDGCCWGMAEYLSCRKEWDRLNPDLKHAIGKTVGDG